VTNEFEYANIVEQLLMAIPELMPLYLENADMWIDDYLPYIVFGFIVVPTMTELLEHDCKNPILKRIFEFVELMIKSDDNEVNTLASVEIAEWIAFENNNVIRTNAIKLMGKQTLEQMDLMLNWRPGN
jgi:hypothetical protein